MERSRVSAVLGPTNTGKTHLALERMLAHASGMIGFPLRLLARENYDRIAKLKGIDAVGLVTGEERILPKGARWLVCTVESMPLDRRVAFLAVDEAQIAADPERGHVFTDRILHARGEAETMFLGSETIKPVLQRLISGAEFITRPRFSKLSYTGPKKPTRLPRRSAVVAFSADEVYALAELMRRQRGGCAVVLGALSPRARNAQVALYQSGEVDYMVATDAIGMGLNMDLDHVAFARLSKFDGRGPRRLTAPEIAQIAGRAGRHQRDGTFGTTAEVGGIDADLVEAIEAHRFDPITQVSWRASDLDFGSVRRLLRALDAPPPDRVLRRKGDADDHRALQALAKLELVERRADAPARVRLLWEVCQIPDFRKIMSDAHVRLLARIFEHLTSGTSRIPEDWIANQIARLDRIDGEIDQLSARLAHIRTWTYVAHRPDWLADPAHWQARGRAIEDRLSDALHEKLTQRFVDRRGAFLIKRLQSNEALLAGVRGDGTVVVEGHPVGRIDGLRFTVDPLAIGDELKPLMTVARRALAQEIETRLARCLAAPDDAIRLGEDGALFWQDAAIARLAPGAHPLAPGVRVLDSELLSGTQRDRLRDHLSGWLKRHLRGALAPLFSLSEAPLSAAARGLAFLLSEALGVVTAEAAAAQIAALSHDDRRALAGAGVRIGALAVTMPALQTRRLSALRARLAALHAGLPWLSEPPRAPIERRRPELPDLVYRVAGYRLGRDCAFRIDRLERLEAAARRLRAPDGFALSEDLAKRIGGDIEDVAAALETLGYRSSGLGAARRFRRPRRRARTAPVARLESDSPFAILAGHASRA